jgi:alkylation response protein AidB-like acyl-CoA dehydrogenase
MAAGDEVWAQAWSEPQAGSDLAAVRASAQRDGNEYVLNGHKIWSSRATFADWAFGLFRSDPDSVGHKGLSLVLFPLNAPGVTVRPIARLDGKLGFAEIFLNEVRVPLTQRIGAEGQGWHLCMATAGFERGLLLRSPARYQMAAAKLVRLYQKNAGKTDRTLQAAVTRAWMDAQSYALSIYSTACRLIQGGKIGAEASINKIFWSELDVALHRTALSILGARAELLPPTSDDEDLGTWLDDYLFALAGPIYAGTNEIQRNIIAERMLGLPR